jgi:hypothetical protein
MLPDPLSAAIAGAAAAEKAGITAQGTAESLAKEFTESTPRTWTPIISRSDVQLTQDPEPAGKLNLIKFPEDMEERGTPYMMIKIYETNTSEIPQPTDEFSASVRTGGNVVSRVVNSFVEAVPAGGALAGGLIGGSVAGVAGAVGGALLGTGAGIETINQFGRDVLGAETDLTSRAKDLVKNFSIRRNTNRLAYGLALFMPDGINTSYDNEYDAISMTATFGAVGLATQALYARGKTETMDPFINEAASRIAAALLGNEDVTRVGLFASTGRVLNPQLEMIYNTPVLRKFVFDFRLIPRSANESALIQTIIKLLKYHAAPTIPDGVGGRYLIPPAQFELEFYNGDGEQNLFLFKTKKCVLSGINIDYTPNGFATFADGAPVETRLQLTFQEVSIIDRAAVAQGF